MGKKCGQKKNFGKKKQKRLTKRPENLSILRMVQICSNYRPRCPCVMGLPIAAYPARASSLSSKNSCRTAILGLPGVGVYSDFRFGPFCTNSQFFYDFDNVQITKSIKNIEKRAIGRQKIRRYGRERALTNFPNLKNLSILRMVSQGCTWRILRLSILSSSLRLKLS